MADSRICKVTLADGTKCVMLFDRSWNDTALLYAIKQKEFAIVALKHESGRGYVKWRGKWIAATPNAWLHQREKQSTKNYIAMRWEGIDESDVEFSFHSVCFEAFRELVHASYCHAK